MFSDAGGAAADASVRSFGAARGMTDEQIEQLTAQVRSTVVKAAEALPHLDSHDIGQVTDLFLEHLVRVHSGRFGPDQLRAWDAQSLADHRAQAGIGATKKTWQEFREVETWLREDQPALYEALQRSSGFSHHPRIVRHLVHAYRVAKAQGARSARASTFMKGASASVLPAAPVVEIGAGG
jgi:hypothetical protein